MTDPYPTSEASLPGPAPTGQITLAVAPDASREWIAPHVASIRELTAAIDAAPERHGGLPTAESRAMSETHTFGALTLRAASDYVRGLAELFDSDHPPLYAHLTLARAALESAVVSAWLSEPGITGLERIKRGLCEMLYSANEVNELELDSGGPENVEFWKGVGASFEWTINNSRTKPIIESTRRPRVSDGIVELTGSSAHVANALYSRLSAVDHVTWFGLISAMDISAAERDERSRTATVAITVDAAKFAMYTYYVVKALRAAAHRRFTLMGWLDEPWRAAEAGAEALEGRLLQIAVGGRATTADPTE